MAIPRTIALLGYYAKSNFGDDLMSHWLARVLSQKSELRVKHYSDDSNGTIKNGLTDKSYLDCDIIAIGGGGIIDPKFWAFRGNGLDKILASGKQVIVLNVNVYREGMVDDVFVSKLRALNAHWWVRDTYSVDLLASNGIDSNFLPDITFREGVIEPIEKHDNKKVASVFLNYNTFQPFFNNSDINHWLISQMGLRTIASYLDWLTRFGWNIQLVPAQTAHHVDDRIPAAMVFGCAIHKQHFTRIDMPMYWQALTQTIQDSDLVISQRYHTTTVALASGVPVVDITHHAKNAGLLDDMGVLELSCSYELFNQESLEKATVQAENLNSYSQKVAAYRMDAHRRWKQFDENWVEILKSLETKCTP